MTTDPLASQLSSQQPAAQPAKPTIGAALPYFLALAVLFVMAYGGWKWWQVRQFELGRGQAIPATAVGPPITDFELTERSGKPFRSAEMAGKVWVATYFFTTCPGTCLKVNQNIQFLNQLPELKDVTWVSITCDPDNDTLAELRKYADGLHADPERWLFCRGPIEYTQRVAKGMSVALIRQGHQDRAIVFDKAGKIRGNFDALSRTDCDRMHTLLLTLQKEEPPQNIAATAADGKKSG
jgi:cytochrome oxidase Cu insertion factor (SCO1/SenC/PrrC family)